MVRPPRRRLRVLASVLAVVLAWASLPPAPAWAHSNPPAASARPEARRSKRLPEAAAELEARRRRLRDELAPPAPAPPAKATPQPPLMYEIHPGFWVGNAAAAAQAAAQGFQAVLNLAQEMELTFLPEASITYRKIGLPDGFGRPIPAAAVREAVEWLRSEVHQGKKTLVCCQRGLGRSGSMAVAYVCALHLEWTYDQALAFVKQRHPHILPHQGLQETIEALYPRSVPAPAPSEDDEE